MAFAPGPDHELADAIVRVNCSVGCLRSKPLVVVFVGVYDKVGSRFIQQTPERLYELRTAVDAARAEERVVPDCERAEGGMGLQVGVKPLHLRGVIPAGNLLAMIACVKDDDVPAADIVAVI